MSEIETQIKAQFDKYSRGLEFRLEFTSTVSLEIINDAPYYTLIFDDLNVGFGLTSFWRAIVDEQVIFSSTDDKQLFGLKEPMNIRDRFQQKFSQFASGTIVIKKGIADAMVLFDKSSRIEIFVDSCGYEPWSFGGSTIQLICLGGGSLAMI